MTHKKPNLPTKIFPVCGGRGWGNVSTEATVAEASQDSHRNGPISVTARSAASSPLAPALREAEELGPVSC